MSDQEQDFDIERALDVLSRLGDVLIVLSDVGSGDYETRCPEDLPDTHPLGALFVGVNEMISSLEYEKKRSSAYQQELEQRLATIEHQRVAIRELSAPIIEVWDSVLCLVVVGSVDHERSQEMTWALLYAVAAKKARYVILDITGIGYLDAATGSHFIGMIKALRFLGTECAITGVGATVAQVFIELDVDLEGTVTHRTVSDALRYFLVRRRG